MVKNSASVSFCLFHLLLQVKAKYLEVGMRMRDYEVKKYERWRDETEQSLPLLMKRTLLTVINGAGGISVDTGIVSLKQSHSSVIFYSQVRRTAF